MKSLMFTRGVALAGALTLTHAATALGAASHAATTATTPIQSNQALAQASGENTALNLTQTAASHAASSSGGGASDSSGARSSRLSLRRPLPRTSNSANSPDSANSSSSSNTRALNYT